MTQSSQSSKPIDTAAVSQSEPIDTAAISQLRKVLQTSDNNMLITFMHGYSLGLSADLFINMMAEPGQRAEFLVAIAKTYPEDWKKAIEELG